MKLYDSTLSPYGARVRLYAARKGIELDIENPPADFQAINPTAKVPCLVDGRLVLPESEVIVEYLEDRFPEPPLRPASAEGRAMARLLARIGDLYVYPALAALFTQMGSPRRDPAVISRKVEELAYGLDQLEAFIGTAGTAVDGGFSTADCALVPILLFTVQFLEQVAPDLLRTHPRVVAYWAAIQQETAVAPLVAELRLALAAFLTQR
ncbi:glutathione S-transferase family protein [Oleomonas cavernae]|uniref:glutathione S-transferase family protein n=1 Tax=Oleomonas cavernae TaxID=2320859 RepID=UPI00131410F6|nr:glutathione S-transferase family protein [Oleomonas cavernae]